MLKLPTDRSIGARPLPMLNFIVKKMGQTRPLFVYFRSFHMTKYSTNNVNQKSVDGVLWTQTQGGEMEGSDESTELAPQVIIFLVRLGCGTSA